MLWSFKKKWNYVCSNFKQNFKILCFFNCGAEYILRWLPVGTHDWEKFVKPEKLIDILKKIA